MILVAVGMLGVYFISVRVNFFIASLFLAATVKFQVYIFSVAESF